MVIDIAHPESQCPKVMYYLVWNNNHWYEKQFIYLFKKIFFFFLIIKVQLEVYQCLESPQNLLAGVFQKIFVKT